MHTVSFEVFRSLSEYEFATFYFDEKTCEIAMDSYCTDRFMKPKKKMLNDESLVNEHCDFTKKFANKYLRIAISQVSF